MNKLDWTNQYLEMDYDELGKLIDSNLNYGVPDDIALKEICVITPSGNVLAKKNIEEILSKPLIIGNKDQVEALEAAEFLKMAEAFYDPPIQEDCEGWVN